MRKRIFLYIASGAILTAIWMVAIYIPYQKKNIQTRSDLVETKRQLQDYERTLVTLPEFIKSYEGIQSSRNHLLAKLYTKNDILKLFEKFYSDAEKRKLKIKEIIPPVEELLRLNKLVADTTQPLYLNINIRLEGKYTDFARFVKQIEDAEFYRGTNICQIIGSREDLFTLSFLYSFRALLGSSGEVS